MATFSMVFHRYRESFQRVHRIGKWEAGPRQWPTAAFDLIVLSEMLYFLSPEDVTSVADRVADTLVADGIVLLVNWRGHSGDPCTGDEAADIFISHVMHFLSVEAHHHEQAYRLDALRRRST
jgi:hypothetical protein